MPYECCCSNARVAAAAAAAAATTNMVPCRAIDLINFRMVIPLLYSNKINNKDEEE